MEVQEFKVKDRSVLATINEVIKSRGLLWVKTWRPKSLGEMDTIGHSYSLVTKGYKCIPGHQLFSDPTPGEWSNLAHGSIKRLYYYMTEEKLENGIHTYMNEITNKPLITLAMDRKGPEAGMITVFLRIHA